MTHTQATAPRRAQLVEEIGLQRHYIDGEFRESVAGGTFTTLDPATNEPITEASDGQAADVDAAVAAARRAFDEGPWPRMKAAERAKVLRRIAELVREHAEEFIEREVLDIGMPIAQMRGLAARAARELRLLRGRHHRAARPVASRSATSSSTTRSTSPSALPG